MVWSELNQKRNNKVKNEFIQIQANIMASPGTDEKGFDVTLSVGGLLISGTITTKDDFYAAPQNARLKAMLDYSEKMFSNDEMEDEDMFKQEPSIYLKDAFYLSGSQIIPSSGKTYILVNLDSIDTVSLGRFEKE